MELGREGGIAEGDTMADDEMVEVFVELLIRETPDAWLILTAYDEEVWLPKSQVELDDDESVVRVPEWLALEKGLI